ncbi:MAG: Maf family protein [Rhodobacteraceae bacterium]|nr:Maf family protein [Paracoccaceae bacterium]
MPVPIVLASGSAIRAQMLRNAAVAHEVVVARVDEGAVKDAMVADGAPARDIADALAEMKARRVSGKRPGALVLGCDQVLDLDGALISKPQDPAEAMEQLQKLRNRRHMLHSAVVIYENNAPIWRQIGTVRLTMRDFGDDWLAGYVARNWDSIRHSVGGYKLEEEGVRLFSRIDGDYFTVLGMPLLELLGYLTTRGEIAG